MAPSVEDRPVREAGGKALEAGMDRMAADASGIGIPPWSSQGPSAMHANLNDVHHDASFANDRTLADSHILRVDRRGRIRLRIIDGAPSSKLLARCCIKS